ncbi:hypothetical protein EV127DRAFT_28076 [Xylaria flabelliformis]|nr:hypothetical protein EV127DRAFT_28076 [Xylaria flabelliformis]KAI0855353.1 hypothetical protein F4860DRAFT_521642 [Xylaria cubensis]
MTTPEVSHGRGGAGNINPDDTQYVDGSIVRQGDVGTHGDGAYSTGRGGAANIADKDAPSATRADKDFVPAEAVRPSMEGDFHTGRGGAANVVHTPETQGQDGAPAAKPPNQGLADKLKHKIFGVFKK